MKIESVEVYQVDPRCHRVVISGPGQSKINAGELLRCAAYRFTVVEVLQRYEAEEVVVAVLRTSGKSQPQPGMVLHAADEPLTREELTRSIEHLVMLSRLAAGVDGVQVAAACDAVGAMPSDSLDNAVQLLRSLAMCAAEFQPTSAPALENVSRYSVELVELLSKPRAASPK